MSIGWERDLVAQTNDPLIAYLIGQLCREGDWHVARCDGLPVATQGRTDGEAIANLVEATQLFIESCIERGTLGVVQAKYGWQPAFRPPQEISSGFAFPVPVPSTLQRD